VSSDVTFATQMPTGVRMLMTDTVALDDDPNEGGDTDGLDGSAEHTLSFTEDDVLHPNRGTT
jgi:hypothetical protein